MVFTILLALSGLTLSAVAIYYSVIGLTAVFAAAFWPVVVMGTTLEISKLVAASWLKTYWTRIPTGMKIYMSTAVIVLMIITSMGIFGFLSKAHLDQNIVSGDVISKISIFDEKIKTSKDNIDANRKALKQMDEAVDQVMGRSSDEKGAEKAVQIRRSQQKERVRLQSEITAEQKNIAALNEERAPIAAEVRKVEAEVGPIKYIAALIYGDNPDTNILEKAVTWVIMIIVFVFDPLAVLMLLGAQMTYQWKKEQEQDQQSDKPDVLVVEADEPTAPEELAEPESVEDTVTKQFVDHGEHPKDNFGYEEKTHTEEVPGETPLTALGGDITATEEKPAEMIEDIPLEQWNKMIEEAEKEVEKEKSAKAQWKAENPDDTIKHHEKLKELGIINELPWEQLTQERKEEVASTYHIFPELQTEVNKQTPEPDFPRNRPDFTEVIEPADQKKNDIHSQTEGSPSKENSSVTYVQNSEQSEESIWQQIKNKVNK
jgi:hypothetical protein